MGNWTSDTMGGTGCSNLRGCNNEEDISDVPVEFSTGGGLSQGSSRGPNTYRIYVLGGTGSAEGRAQLSSVESMDVGISGNRAWDSVVSLQKPRLGACAAVLKNVLYSVGGWNAEEHDKSSECLDLTEEPPTWNDVAEMKAPRTFAGMTTIGGSMYVCGGMTTGSNEEKEVSWNTCTAEVYKTATKTWKGLPSMSVARLGPAVVAAQINGAECIVAIGGVDAKGKPLSSVEKLDISTMKWSGLIDLPSARAAGGAVCYKNEIYMFGGCAIDGVPTGTCFKLDKAQAAWVEIPELNVPRGGFGVALAGSTVVVVGGSAKHSGHLRGTEMLNLDKLGSPEGCWTLGPDMALERRYPAVAVHA